MKTENNGVYFGKDGYFMTKFKEPEEKRLDGNIEHVKALSESLDIPFYFSLIPTSAHTLKDKLPEFSYPYDQDKILQKAQDIKGYFDLSNTLLEHKNEYIYYKTDHHWTSKGAYYAYVKICEAMGIVPSEEPEILEEHKDFFGTLFSNSGARFVDGDTVTLYNTKKLLVKDATGEEIPLYDLSFGDKKDKYSIFLGGNAPLITIENTENQDAPTILLIKDSYSNSLVPLLSNNFSKIYVWRSEERRVGKEC